MVLPRTSASVSAAAQLSWAAATAPPPRLAEARPLASSGAPRAPGKGGPKAPGPGQPGVTSAGSRQARPLGVSSICTDTECAPGCQPVLVRVSHPAGCCPTHPLNLPVSCQKRAGKERHGDPAAPGFLPLHHRDPSQLLSFLMTTSTPWCRSWARSSRFLFLRSSTCWRSTSLSSCSWSSPCSSSDNR